MPRLLETALVEVLKGVGWGILITLVVLAVWLSPVGKFLEEFEEFRKWKREQKK